MLIAATVLTGFGAMSLAIAEPVGQRTCATWKADTAAESPYRQRVLDWIAGVSWGGYRIDHSQGLAKSYDQQATERVTIKYLDLYCPSHPKTTLAEALLVPPVSSLFKE